MIGYARVGLAEKAPYKELAGAEVSPIYLDVLDGMDLRRPELESLIKSIQRGDTIYVPYMARLGRSLHDLRRLIKTFTDLGAEVFFARENLRFGRDEETERRFPLYVLSALDRFERDLRCLEQRPSIESAKAFGIFRGRKPSLSLTQAYDLRRRIADGESKTALAREFGISRETVYRYVALKELRLEWRRRINIDVSCKP